MNNKAIAIVAAVLGLLFLIAGVLYFTQPAGSLPSFFPGYAAKSNAHHSKHGIAAIVVGICCFVFAWFQTGAKSTSGAGK